MKMKYDGSYNPDTLFYSGTILYKFDPVATLIFQYLEVRYKVWDHFLRFGSDNKLSLRF